MAIIGITGGIASGKSTFAKLLLKDITASHFDCDVFVHQLLDSDAATHERLMTIFGAAIFDSEGKVDRAILRDRVFSDPEGRTQLEGIIHPRVRAEWTNMAQQCRESQTSLVVEIPLLFELDTEGYFDRTVVVACSKECQLDRLTSIRHLSRETAEKIISAQLPLEIKMKRATHVIWNEGASGLLVSQSNLLGKIIHRHV